MKRLICTLAILILTFTLSQAQSTKQSEPKKKNQESSSNLQAAAVSPVSGSGTAGRLSKWTGVDGSNSFTLGNSILFEDKFGKVGIGTTAPTSTLTVVGMIQTTLGGYKFPDGTVQTTAGLASVFHNATLTGNGTVASPLGVAIPLELTGSVPGQLNSVLKVTNTGNFGNGISGFGGALGAGVRGVGGNGDQTGFGGPGVLAFGGGTTSTIGGHGVHAFGGSTTSGTFSGGAGVLALGGRNDTNGPGGSGIEAVGGLSNSGPSGPGVRAFGGAFRGQLPGDGVVATGGNYEDTDDQVFAGTGVVATGGDAVTNGNPGTGVVAAGGNGKFGGVGVKATGGTSSINTPGGTGVLGIGGNTTGNTGAGAGVRGVGGTSQAGLGGTGVTAAGGGGELFGGFGLDAFGGRGNGGDAGPGIRSFGGGGGFPGGATGNGGDGVIAVGGEAHGAGKTAGDGIVARGGQGVDGATAGRAGVFTGHVEITGSLNVTGTKNFKIDHPLDPENKYLSHAAIESSEVLNVYSGNIVTDARGEATVTLPDWFEALNKDLRYQLTVIGQFAQAIVAEKVKGNRFRIRTSEPNTEVSWQVTGVRSDAAMLKRPFKPEEAKPERERGTYLNPAAYNQPEDKGAEWARHPEMMRQMKATGEKQIEGAKQKAQSRDR